MKTILFFILTLTTTIVVGQTHSIGIKSGLNWTNVTSDFLSGTDSRTGITSGLTYEYIAPKRLSVGIDIIYNQRGFSLTLPNNSGSRMEDGPRADFNYNYLSIPIKTGLHYGRRKLYTFGSVGVVPSLLINAKTIYPKFDVSGTIVGSETIDVTGRVAKFDVAGLLEVGAGYNITNKYIVFTALAYQHSLTSITTSDYFANSKIRHNGYNFSVGLRRSLTKK